MKYRLNFLDSSYLSDRYVHQKFDLQFDNPPGRNYNDRFVILDEGQAIILKLMYPVVTLIPITDE